MKYMIRRYFTGFCTYEIEANSEIEAYNNTKNSNIDYEEICSTLEEWNECNEVEQINDN